MEATVQSNVSSTTTPKGNHEKPSSTPKKKNPVQVLSQSVCHRYGWSATFLQQQQEQQEQEHHEVVWTCTVQTGWTERWTFTATTAENTKAAVAQMALDGLQERITAEEQKPLRELVDVVAQNITIYESNEENWAYVWEHSKPRVVGIDTEGNLVAPPILVQVAIEDYVILEVPSVDGGLSRHLQRLLNDNSIVKVFCDNYSHKDKKSLGIAGSDDKGMKWDTPPIIDLESLAATTFGPVTVARGLGRIMNLMEMYHDVRIGKPKVAGTTHRNHIGRFVWMEQGKAPRITSVNELTNQERYYAAIDAMCTLWAYELMMEKTQQQSSTLAP